MTSLYLPQQAMILAAGRGKRMRPLTDTLPKPLLEVAGKPLIVWHIKRLARAGVRHIVINTAWCGMQIPKALGDGAKWGVKLHYSHEAPPGLETAGGIACAIKRGLLDTEQPFLVLNGDTWCDDHLDAGCLSNLAQPVFEKRAKVSLLLAHNPPHHPEGDFYCPPEGGWACYRDQQPTHPMGTLTFTGIGVYQPDLFQELAATDEIAFTPLRELLKKTCEARHVWGQAFEGLWYDIGTPERLSIVRQRVTPASPSPF